MGIKTNTVCKKNRDCGGRHELRRLLKEIGLNSISRKMEEIALSILSSKLNQNYFKNKQTNKKKPQETLRVGRRSGAGWEAQRIFFDLTCRSLGWKKLATQPSQQVQKKKAHASAVCTP